MRPNASSRASDSSFCKNVPLEIRKGYVETRNGRRGEATTQKKRLAVEWVSQAVMKHGVYHA